MIMSSKVLAVALVAATAPWFAAPANAVPISSLAGVRDAAAPTVEAVRYRRGWGGAGAGFVAGAIIGGAIANSRSYGYGGYGPYGYGGGYGYAPVYDQGYIEPGYAPQGYIQRGYVIDRSYARGGDVGYCQQRFRSYDPSSGTYLGFDGLRHPCP